ncbi:MAG: hypothetical protein DDT42_01856 [candidate division WS2 bacterium]|uniref:Uncharacterized protein n=1 Tax=Psychracetigena formicireducens TaxID=2986056 RepID=A0A9E2F2Q2_PSYF1|nr:hypothetical protein [Candidatus Psychracetigena formicireducens]
METETETDLKNIVTRIRGYTSRLREENNELLIWQKDSLALMKAAASELSSSTTCVEKLLLAEELQELIDRAEFK